MQKMNLEKLIESLDFSGGPNSWFNLWHTHVDWDGKGSKDWETRRQNIGLLVELFKIVKNRLINYPKPFQLWILISEGDRSQNALYLHSPNPNEDNFPIRVKKENELCQNDKNLKNYLEKLEFKIVMSEFENELQYFYI